jgi:hypothetical protein
VHAKACHIHAASVACGIFYALPRPLHRAQNASFWHLFDGVDHLLLFQTDSIILRPGLEDFARFDYIGAPWHLENERWSQPALKAALPDGVGNGGFSLRSPAAMAAIAEAAATAGAPHPSHPTEQEDVFFAAAVQRDSSLRLADRRAAYTFCMEVTCADITADGATSTGSSSTGGWGSAPGGTTMRVGGQPVEQVHHALHAAWYYSWAAPIQVTACHAVQVTRMDGDSAVYCQSVRVGCSSVLFGD